MKTAMEKSSHAQTGARERTKKHAAGVRDHRDVSLPPASIDKSPVVIAQRMQIRNVFGDTVQRQPLEEEEEGPLQGKFTTGTLLQRQPSPNRTGLPDELKTGIEGLSGLSLDDVRVHYNSPQPAELQALAYTQGTDIHVAPGEERHLPHEAWHVVQQMQGRVQPTMHINAGIPVNDDSGLEHEATRMGDQAFQRQTAPIGDPVQKNSSLAQGVMQLTCEICGSEDHTWKKCPYNIPDVEPTEEKATISEAPEEKTPGWKKQTDAPTGRYKNTSGHHDATLAKWRGKKFKQNYTGKRGKRK